MASTDSSAVTYANDEHIAIHASGDFAVLCPDWQKLAQGVDGSLSLQSPWLLTSASVNFAAAGVSNGHVIVLRKPASVFKGSGELLAVESASSQGVMLRRLGVAASLGQPPAPSSGVSGVEFLIATLTPQIEQASFDLSRRFGIDPNMAGRTPADVYDLRDLRQACVLSVLAQRYAAETRGNQGDFVLKLSQVRNDLGDVLARLSVRWGQSGTDRKSTNRFSTRIVR